jgi:hypothetical protein
MSCTQSPPVNACGFPATKNVWNGGFAGGTSCNDYATSATVTPYARRCHPITGLASSDSIQFRWRFSSDPGAEFAGFYLDDIAVSNITLPGTCAPDTCGGQGPAEVAGVVVDDSETTTLTWIALAGGVAYDVASSTLADLRVNGTSTATCLANDVTSTVIVDGRADPVAGDGYYYLIRGSAACGSGSYGTDSLGAPRLPTPGCP